MAVIFLNYLGGSIIVMSCKMQPDADILVIWHTTFDVVFIGTY